MADETPQAGNQQSTPTGRQEQPVTAGQAPAGDANQPESVDALPAWAQKVIADLRGEAAANRKKAQDERKQAEEKRLEEQQKWEQLATQRAAEIAGARRPHP